MSRAGITTSEIHRTCAALVEKGIPVTVEAVRAKTGGSNSTIAPVVRAWKAQQSAALPSADLRLPPDLIQATQDVFDRAQAHADLRIQEVNQMATAAAATAAQAAMIAAEREAKLEIDNIELRDLVVSLGAKIRELELSCTAANLRIRELETLASQQEKWIADRDESLVALNRKYSTLEERASEQLQALRVATSAKLDEATAEILLLRTEKASLEAQIESLQHQKMELRKNTENAREDSERARTELAQHIIRTERLEKDLCEATAQCQSERELSRSTAQELSEVRLALASKEGEARILQRDLARIQQLHDKLNQEAVVWRQERHAMSEMIRQFEASGN